MSMLTQFLGEFYGLSIALMCATLVVRPRRVLEALRSLTDHPGLLYITGAFTLMGGVAAVLGHNDWTGGAVTIVVTVLGWLALIKGLALLFISPGALAAFYKVIQTPMRLRITGVIYVIFGLWLAWAACLGAPAVAV